MSKFRLFTPMLLVFLIVACVSDAAFANGLIDPKQAKMAIEKRCALSDCHDIKDLEYRNFTEDEAIEIVEKMRKEYRAKMTGYEEFMIVDYLQPHNYTWYTPESRSTPISILDILIVPLSAIIVLLFLYGFSRRKKD